jgi:hypothetical protein
MDSAVMPVPRSQNTSFHKKRKVTSASKRQKSNENIENPLGNLHLRTESQRLKVASIEFDPENELEHLHDFNITQISIKVDSKRNTLDLGSSIRLKQLHNSANKIKSGSHNPENRSIASLNS